MEQNCKECKEPKDLSEFYKHPQWKNWVLWRCKECVKKWRRSEGERKMARILDKKRAKNPDRIKYSTENTKKYRAKNPEKRNAHKIVNNYFRYHKKDKPKKCSHCLGWWQIELHHEDYSKPREFIPLCSLCHKWKHKWKIKIDIKNIIII